MQFLLNAWPYDRWGGIESLANTVREADTLGFDGFALPEHLFTPPEHVEGFGNNVWYDPFVLAANLAGRTQRIRFVFKVLVVPLRHPVHTARMAATLDQVSGGRLTIAIGAGWCETDFAAVGIPFDQRGARTDEYLAAMRSWWLEDRPSADGTFGRYGDAIAEPKCLQRPHVPLWIGGDGRASVRRAGAFGDGWAPMPAQLDFNQAVWTMRRIRGLAEDLGREGDALDFVWRLGLGAPDESMVRVHRAVHSESGFNIDRHETAEQTLEAIQQFADAGVSVLEVSFAWTSPAEYRERAHRFAEEILPHVPGRKVESQG